MIAQAQRDNRRMDTSVATPLLGGLSPRAFMRRHWQKKPLLIRQAVPGVRPPASRQALFELAARDDVESRLVCRRGTGWTLDQGPFARRRLPPLAQPGWTLLVQGVDLHIDAAHALLQTFRFVPDARLDDLMVSYASEGGGVGPHFDSYDVFLLQVQGRRRWRIGRNAGAVLEPGVPLKIIANFEPEVEWLLEPGDMLYLPPRWAHDGVAEGGDCITCSIGFRAPARAEAGRELLHRLLDAQDDTPAGALYRDASQSATASPACLPPALAAFARDAVARLVADGAELDCALGEWLTEPKPQVYFDEGRPVTAGSGARLDRRTRMLYDDRHVYINGESFRAGGRDARLMRLLGDTRRLVAKDVARLSPGARGLLGEWAQAGWLHADTEDAP